MKSEFSPSMARPRRVLIALHRIGPYHHVRFEAAHATGLDLMIIQTRPRSLEYPWMFQPQASYEISELGGAQSSEHDPANPALDQQLEQELDSRSPDVVVSVGWADRAYQRLLLACHRRRTPIVIISDSRYRDEARFPPKEWLKSVLLRGYSAALVAGHESRHYLDTLGFPPASIFSPWDVVDNAFFSQTAIGELQLLRHEFLCVSRFVAKKNFAGLLEAFGLYQSEGGTWGLRLIGSGPLESAIRAAIATLPDPSMVRVDPFLQLKPLARAYGEARAFVLASTIDQWGLVVNEAMAAGLPVLVSRACGCAADLINHGVTGWTFDPADPAALAALMHTAECQSPSRRQAMTSAARDRLSTFSPARFADGLRQALEWASVHPRFSRRAALMADLFSRRELLR